jgi:hypothetical protein
MGKPSAQISPSNHCRSDGEQDSMVCIVPLSNLYASVRTCYRKSHVSDFFIVELRIVAEYGSDIQILTECLGRGRTHAADGFQYMQCCWITKYNLQLRLS